MLVYHNVTPRHCIRLPWQFPVLVYTPGWRREALWEQSVLPRSLEPKFTDHLATAFRWTASRESRNTEQKSRLSPTLIWPTLPKTTTAIWPIIIWLFSFSSKISFSQAISEVTNASVSKQGLLQGLWLKNDTCQMKLISYETFAFYLTLKVRVFKIQNSL